MPLNQFKNFWDNFAVLPSQPTYGNIKEDGLLVRVGTMIGVNQTLPDANNLVVMDFINVYNLPVSGTNAAGNVAVAIGDALYFQDANTYSDAAGNTVNYLNKDDSGYFAGFAMGTVGSGVAQAVIPVRLAGGGVVPKGDVSGIIAAPTVAVGSVVSHVCSVTVTVKDIAGIVVQAPTAVEWWLSDTALGAESATAPTSATTASTGTLVGIHGVNSTIGGALTTNAGVLVLVFTQTATKNYYLNAKVGGKVTASAVIAFP